MITPTLDLQSVYDQLTHFAGLASFWQTFETVFGTEYDFATAEALRLQWANGDFSQLPPIEVVSGEVLGPALGAYAASLNKIYLSESFLATATVEQMVAVVLEEIGHYVDSQVNASDTPGDEGEYFSSLVLGDSLSNAQIASIKTEDDTAIISVNGVPLQVEQANYSVSPMSYWNGSVAVGSFGEFNTATYGQTFTVPTILNPTLNNFTVYVNDYVNPDFIDFAFYIMAWDGLKAAGPILYQSSQLSTTGFNGMEAFVFDTNRLSLNPGQPYVAFVSASNYFDNLQGYGVMGAIQNNAYSGGSWVYFNNSQDFSALTSYPWTVYSDYDLAFQANFSSNTASPNLTSISSGSLIDTAAYDTFSNITGTLVGNDADTDVTLTYGISGVTGGVTLVQNLVVDSQKNVASVGQPHVLSSPLTAGVQYKIVVSGTWRPTYGNPSWEADARYVSNNFWSSAQDFDPNGTSDMGLYSSVLGNSDDIWGAYNSSHVYSALITGTGSPIDFYIQDLNFEDNLGVYQVAIYEIQSVTKAGAYGNLTLNPLTGQYTYTPNNSAINALPAGNNDTDTFTFTVSDGEFSDSETFTVNLTRANDTASINGTSTANLTEDDDPITLTATDSLTVTDVDAGENKFNTTISSSLENLGSLTITEAGVWNYSLANSAVQYLGATQTRTETFTVQSFDVTASQDITVTISGINDEPNGLTLAGNSIDENSLANSIVGTFGTTDPDASDTFTYTLVDGYGDTDNSAFTIDGDTLKLAVSPNYEVKNSYSIRVKTTDLGGASREEVFTITVNDVNEAPTVALDNQTNSLLETTDTSTRIKVADITVTDDALGTNSLSLSGDDAASFEIDGMALYLKAGTSLDFETKANYSVVVEVDDVTVGATPDNTVAFNLALIDVNEAPLGNNVSRTLVEDGIYTFSINDFSFTDIENDGLWAVKITTLPTLGTLKLGNTTINVDDFISVASIPNLTYTPPKHANRIGTTPYASFTFQVQDDGGTANGGIDLDSTANTFDLFVTPDNDAPVGTDATLNPVNEDTPNPPGATVSTLFTSKFSDSIDQVTNGSGADGLLGIAIVGNAALANQGKWQYRNGTVWTDIPTTGLSDTLALYLPSATLVRFLPVANYNGTPGSLSVHIVENNSGTGSDGTLFPLTTITNNFNISDTTGTGNGGTTSISDDPVALGTTIRPLNDPPSILGLDADFINYKVADGSVRIDQASPTGPASITDLEGLKAGGILNISLSVVYGLDPASNTLGFTGNVTKDGSNVLIGATTVGTIDATNNGLAGNSLSITFNSNITNTLASTLLQNITYTYSGSATGLTSLIFTVLDGGDGYSGNPSLTSNQALVDIYVSPTGSNITPYPYPGGNNSGNTLYGNFSTAQPEVMHGKASNDILYGYGGADILFGDDGNDNLFGGNDNDVLVGGNGVDQLYGDAGNDLLIGGAGKDQLSGGTGADNFSYRNLGDSLLSAYDWIRGFKSSESDLILVPSARSSVFTATKAVTGSALTEIAIRNVLTDIETDINFFDANAAAFFTWGTKSFIALNDSYNGFSSSSDAIIEVTGYTGIIDSASFGLA